MTDQPTDVLRPDAAVPPIADPEGGPPSGGSGRIAAPRRRLHAVLLGSLAGTVLAGCQGPTAMPSRGAVTPASEGGDWLDSVRAEHQAIDAAFGRMLETGDAATRAELRDALSDALALHALQEETVLYPALAMAGLKTEPPQLFADHAQVKVLIAELAVLPADHPSWPSRASKLRQLVAQHAREEEAALYPPFRASLSPGQNAALTARYRVQRARFEPD